MDTETIKEVAKATQSLAPTINNASDSLKKIIGAPFEELGGLLSDSLRRMRIKNWVTFQPKLMQLMQEAGIRNYRETIPSRTVYELIEGITKEDNDELQDLWAKLTKNILDPNSNVDLTGWQIGLLKQLNPLEARILQKLVLTTPEEQKKFEGGFPTGGLPDSFLDVNPKEGELPKPSQIVEIAIWHLISLGLLVDTTAFNNGRQIYWVGPTTLGSSLVEACT